MTYEKGSYVRVLADINFAGHTIRTTNLKAIVIGETDTGTWAVRIVEGPYTGTRSQFKATQLVPWEPASTEIRLDDDPTVG